LIFVAYFYYLFAIFVLVDSLYHALIDNNVSFISDIRTINNLYLPLFLLSMDLEFEISKKLENLFTSKSKKEINYLENVSAEVMNEVDLIIRNYVIVDPVQ
jgi:hypothetical protein